MSIGSPNGFNSPSTKRQLTTGQQSLQKAPKLSSQQDSISISLAKRTRLSENIESKGSALLWWVQQNKPEKVKALLEQAPKNQQADIITQPDEYGRTPLLWAAEHENLSMVEALIDKVPQSKLEEMLIKPDQDVVALLCEAIDCNANCQDRSVTSGFAC